MSEELTQLKKQVESLTKKISALESVTTIPHEVDRAFRQRFKDIAGLSLSEKSTDSEDVTVVDSVNFGTSSTTTTAVLNDPDAWLQLTLNGIPYYIPTYTS